MADKIYHIIKACLRKNSVAQKELYDRYVDRLYYTAIRYVDDSFYVENILQDVFLKVFTRLESFDPSKASFTTWINTITIRECLNHLRKNNLHFEALDNHANELADNIDPLLLQMEAEEILGLILRIPQKYRTIFNLYEIDGYSHNEISQMLSINTSTSRSYLTRAKKLIQQEISLVSTKGN